MKNKGEKTLEEILSQPAVWAETLKVFERNARSVMDLWQHNQFEQVIFIGCGSTYYLSLSASVIFQQFNGISSRALPGSELGLFKDIYLNKNKKTLLLAISRSGETTETVRAMQLFREGGFGRTIAITTVPDSSVTKYADHCLIADAAQEVSIAQTRSFGCMQLLAQALALQLSGQNAVEILANFPEIVARLFDHYHDLVRSLGEDRRIERFFFLGSAYYYGIACEAMLKMKEMSLSNSEAFHMLEFRHGPKAMVDDNSLVVGLVNDLIVDHEIPVLQEMVSLRSKLLSIVEKKDERLERIGDVIELQSGIAEPLRTILFLPVLQLMAYYRAISRGQDPDNPNNLDAVVQIPSMIN